MAITIAAGIPFPAEATTASGCIGFKKAGKVLVPCGKVTRRVAARIAKVRSFGGRMERPHRRGVQRRRDAQRRRARRSWRFLQFTAGGG